MKLTPKESMLSMVPKDLATETARQERKNGDYKAQYSGCSCKGLWLGPKQSHGNSQPSITTILGVPTPVHTSSVHKYTHAKHSRT